MADNVLDPYSIFLIRAQIILVGGCLAQRLGADRLLLNPGASTAV